MNKIVIIFTLLIFSTPLAFSDDECKSQMDAYSKTQTITSNLLNYLSDPAKMREVTDYYGEQNQIAEAYLKEGKYQEACDTYQGVIDKYDMKTIEEQYYEKHPEKRAEHQEKLKKSNESSSSSNSEADSSDTVSEKAVDASDSVSDSASKSAEE